MYFTFTQGQKPQWYNFFIHFQANDRASRSKYIGYISDVGWFWVVGLRPQDILVSGTGKITSGGTRYSEERYTGYTVTEKAETIKPCKAKLSLLCNNWLSLVVVIFFPRLFYAQNIPAKASGPQNSI